MLLARRPRRRIGRCGFSNRRKNAPPIPVAAPRGAEILVAQTRRLRSEDEGMAIASRYFATVRRAT
jgi:hypothetical protein